MRGDAGSNEPAKELVCPVRRIGGKPRGLEIEPSFGERPAPASAELRLGLAGRAREAAVAHQLHETLQIVEGQGLAMTPPDLPIVSPKETVCRSHAVYR